MENFYFNEIKDYNERIWSGFWSFTVSLPTAMPPENFYAYPRLRIAHSVHQAQVQILRYCIKKFFMTNEFQDITILKNEETSNTVGYSC